MDLIADGLMIFGALSAALYCLVLSRRVRRLGGLDSGLGAAIATLSVQVDDLKRSLEAAQSAADAGTGALDARVDRAERAANRLELMLAALHEPDAPPAAPARPAAPPAPKRPEAERIRADVMDALRDIEKAMSA